MKLDAINAKKSKEQNNFMQSSNSFLLFLIDFLVIPSSELARFHLPLFRLYWNQAGAFCIAFRDLKNRFSCFFLVRSPSFFLSHTFTFRRKKNNKKPREFKQLESFRARNIHSQGQT